MFITGLPHGQEIRKIQKKTKKNDKSQVKMGFFLEKSGKGQEFFL